MHDTMLSMVNKDTLGFSSGLCSKIVKNIPEICF